jgi:heme/copper-type cytochrome/quinol oxidase subunit 2
MSAFFILLQTLDMTESEFKAVIVRVIVVGVVTMGISFWLLWLFWRRLEAESAAGEHKTRMSTLGYLIALVIVLILMSIVVYSFG